MHGCREAGRGSEAVGSGVVAGDAPGGPADAPAGEGRDDRFATLVVLASAAAIAVFLLGGAVAVGVVSPSDVVGGAGGPADATEEPFDESAFRSTVLSAINDRRASVGSGRLPVDERRQSVADRFAADMAAANFFENESARESPEFSLERRLAAADLSCSDRPRASYFLKTYYGRPVGEDETVYETTGEVARNVAETILAETRQVTRTTGFDGHALGVHETEDGGVYVVYLVC